MDLTEDIRYKLYHLIRGNITERKKSIVDQTSLEMGDLVAAWITGRLDKSLLLIRIRYITYRILLFLKKN